MIDWIYTFQEMTADVGLGELPITVRCWGRMAVSRIYNDMQMWNQDDHRSEMTDRVL